MDSSFMGNTQEHEERAAERAIWMATPEKARQETIKKLARQMALANNSDPFVYARTVSHLKSSIYTPQDYRAQLKLNKKR